MTQGKGSVFVENFDSYVQTIPTVSLLSLSSLLWILQALSFSLDVALCVASK
jgi:hypothetical protein